jgi:hypothetical protein
MYKGTLIDELLRRVKTAESTATRPPEVSSSRAPRVEQPATTGQEPKNSKPK